MENQEDDVKRLELGGEWSLLELSGFGRPYVQLYCFFYSLEYGLGDEESAARIIRAFNMYPWMGGWSAVDFFEQLRYAVPPEERPRVKQIEYASPGFIDLWAVLPPATQISISVGSIVGAAAGVVGLVRSIDTWMREREMHKLDVRDKQLKIAKQEMDLLKEHAMTLEDALDLPKEYRDHIEEISPTQLARVKILRALVRRALALAKLQSAGKIKF